MINIYRSIIIASVIGFCLIIAWYRATTSVLRLYSLFPSSFSRFFRSKLTVPALFGTRHSQSLRFEIGYAPSRFLSLAIFIYVAVNVVFSVVPIKQPQQNTWAIDDRTETVGFISNRTGVLGFANMALAILTAGRNNPLLMVTGWNYTTFITFHRWAARVATVQAIIHSLIYTITFFCSGVASSYYTDITLRNYAWGILGTVAMTLMISFSVLAVRRRWYESFVVIHIVLGILVLLGCWLHVDFRTSRLGYELWLYLAVGFWGFDRLARLSRITYRNYIRGRSKAYAQLLPGKKLVKLTVFPSIPWNFRAGQYCFLYIPALGRFYESHPFSIAYQNTGSLHGTVSVLGPREGRDDVEKKNGLVTATSLSSPLPSPTTTVFTEFLEIEDESEQGSVSFIIRAKDGVTKQLRNSLLASGETRVPLSVTIEGPYGRLPSLAAAETILCIAGGIGITSILGLIQQHIEEQRNGGRFKRLLLVWTAKEQPLIDFVHSRLPDNPDAYGIELRITCTGGQTMGFRPNLEALVHEEARRTKSLAVVVCGPARMSDCVRKGVVESIKAGNQIELHEEAFAW